MLSGILARAYYHRACGKLAMGDYHRALYLFTKSLSYRPDTVAALCDRSVAFQALGEHLRAITDLDHVIELNPKLGLAYFNRGISEKLLCNLDKAITDQARAIALCASDAKAYGELGVVHMLKLEWEPAIVNLTQAIKLDPAEASHPQNRGFTQFFRGEFGAAADDLDRSLSITHDPYVLLLYCLAQSRMGLNGIGQLRDSALGLDLTKWPGPIINLFLGSISPDALITEAIEDRKKAEGHFYIGQWYLLRNALTEAVAALKEAERLCPVSFPEHAGALAELERLGCLQQST